MSETIMELVVTHKLMKEIFSWMEVGFEEENDREMTYLERENYLTSNAEKIQAAVESCLEFFRKNLDCDPMTMENDYWREELYAANVPMP